MKFLKFLSRIPYSCFLFLSLCLLFSSCVRNPVTGKREFHMISKSAELRLGQDTKSQIIKEYGLYSNPAVQSYVNEVSQKIVSVCERKDIPYDFVILDTPLVNAFAVPGTVFLTRGILELIDDEAELASVIGHEVGHITGYHAVKLIQKAFGYQFLSTFATVAVAIYGPPADDPRAYAVLNQATNLVAAGFLSGYGREFELEADRSGLRYTVLAGYDPDAMVSFFKRMRSLGEEKAYGIEIFLRTHPETEDRIKQVKRELDSGEDDSKRKRKKKQLETQRKFITVLKSTTTLFEDNFERYQEIVKSMPKLGVVESGVIKENSFEHKGLKVRIDVPKGWKLNYSYGKALVTFSSPDGKAQGELQTIKLQPDPVLTADEKSSFAGISVSTQILTAREWGEGMEERLKMEKRTGRDVAYPAGPSYVGTYKGRDRLGRPAHFKILYILRGEKRGEQEGFIISCAAPEDTYLDYLVDFETIMKSFGWIK